MHLAAVPVSPARRTIAGAIAFGLFASQYRDIRNDGLLTFRQFECAVEHGHDWRFTGTAYGGDDESYRGEGRVYCSRCGADGDA